MEFEKIKDEDSLLRRYPLNPSYVRSDGTVSRYAFAPGRNDSDGISVNLERLSTIKDTVIDKTKFGLLRVIAGGNDFFELSRQNLASNWRDR